VTALCTAACTTRPSQVRPIPDSCLEHCLVNTCTLGESYEDLPNDAKGDQEAAETELMCDRENADAARACAKLHEKCGDALTELKQ
jgi:hypothetical protein